MNKEKFAFFRKIANFTFIFQTVFIVLNWLLTCFSLFGSDYFYNSVKIYLAPFSHEPWPKESVLLKLFVLLCILFDHLSCAFFYCFFISKCAFTYILLNNFNKKFKEFVQKGIIVSDDSAFLTETKHLENSSLNDQKLYFSERRLEYFRVWHFKLSLLVRSLNANYNINLGFNFLVNICIIFLCTFMMSDWNNNCIIGSLQFYIPSWTINSFFVIALIIFLSSGIAKRVKKQQIL